ncbi:MAG: hypothetical protein P8Y60_00365 [Calditrichota bacterium]|jgi:hypothetical protein
MLNQKSENLFNNIVQLLGEESLVKPSVLIPQSKVNHFMQDFFKEARKIEQVLFDFSEEKCNVIFKINYLARFNIEFEITFESIALVDTSIEIKLKRITNFRFRAGNYSIGFILKLLHTVIEKILAINLLEIATRRIKPVSISGRDISIKFPFDEFRFPPEIGKWLNNMGEKVSLEKLQFVKGGIRLTISFRIMNPGT